MLIQHVVNPLFLICQHNFFLKMLLDTAEAPIWRISELQYKRTFCDSVCKLLSTIIISDYSCQDPGARGQVPLKANVKDAYNIKFFKMKNLIGSLAEIFIPSRRQLYQIKRCLNKNCVHVFFPSSQVELPVVGCTWVILACTCVISECLLNKGQM